MAKGRKVKRLLDNKKEGVVKMLAMHFATPSFVVLFMRRRNHRIETQYAQRIAGYHDDAHRHGRMVAHDANYRHHAGPKDHREKSHERTGTASILALARKCQRKTG